LVRDFFCSPLAPHHGWFCCRRCWSEHASASLLPLALLVAMVGSVAVAVGSSILLLAFGSQSAVSGDVSLVQPLLLTSPIMLLVSSTPSPPLPTRPHGPPRRFPLDLVFCTNWRLRTL
jgi:hypothetical protein